MHDRNGSGPLSFANVYADLGMVDMHGHCPDVRATSKKTRKPRRKKLCEHVYPYIYILFFSAFSPDFFIFIKMEMKAQKRTFEAKIDSLETKVEQLEEKVQEHESLLLTLRKEQSTKSVSKSVELSHALRRNSIHRTCREIRAADPSLPSGMYWVDPDGDGIGHDSIHVYCNMTSGTKT